MAIHYIQNELDALHDNLQKKIRLLSAPLEFKETKQTLAEKMEKLEVKSKLEVDSTSLAKLKRSSADITYRLIALTREYQSTDVTIQSLNNKNVLDKVKFEKIFEQLVVTEKALIANLDDYRRLKLIFAKFMFTNFNLKLENAADDQKDAEAIEEDDNEERQTKNEEETDSGSDFFALRYSDEESDDEEMPTNRKQRIEDELQEFDFKIARTNFAPVLKQLKRKIDPLKDEMKERELKFLVAKGFDRKKILNSVEETPTKDNESDSESSLEDFPRPKKSQRNFDEMRAFLESKQQMLMLPTMMPNPSMGEEEILE